MCSDEERATAGGSGNGKLRQWLIEQVDTGKYPGLVWENDDKSIFRIPWKHAGKQDYNREEDAALFKAWALFKGKYREGIDRPDPPTWKTRLRCALNKSNDFEELVERSQLDISDPYKVYKIVPEGLKKGPKSMEDSLPTSSPPHYLTHPPPAPAPPPPQMCSYISPAEREWRDYTAGLAEITYSPFTPRWDPGYQFSGSLYSCNPSDPQLSPFSLDTSMAVALSDYRLHITVYYRDIPVREVTISSPEGCQLGPANASPGVPELVELPEAEGSSLERGLMLWMAPDGLYARRRCPRRVYWTSSDKHNKLEREHTCKLLDTQLFITELQSYALHARPVPSSAVLLLFDDEDSDGQRPRQTTAVKVEPMFARQLLILAHSGGANYIRTHDFTRLPPEQHLFTQSHAPSAQQHC